jgi:DNA topoisomerase-2
MFTCFNRNLDRELKVEQLAGSVTELSAYHDSDQSLMSTIINLAQNFVGSNNLNLLLPIGQFGSRLKGGKDFGKPHKIFTALHPLTRLLFNPKDDPLLNYINDDGQLVEPDFYCPILPTVLVNGAEGIGTGWSTRIPNYNPRDIIQNLKCLINGEQTKSMRPYFKNFRGQIDQIDETRVITSGEVAVIDDNTIEITELPISVWTQAYKESVLEPSLHGEEKKPPTITDYREYHTDTTVRFVVKMTPDQFKVASSAGLHKFFKLQKPLSLNSMVLFDHNGCLRRYDNVNDILLEFHKVRTGLYVKRKEYMEGMLGAESLMLDNISRFILEKIEGKIKVETLKTAEIIQILLGKKYDPDPIAKWKQRVVKERGYNNEDTNLTVNEDEIGDEQSSNKHDFDYLLSIPILTMEKKDEILKQQKTKADEVIKLKAKTPSELWLDELDQFLSEMEQFEQKEKEEDAAAQLKAYKAGQANKGASIQRGNEAGKQEYLPSQHGERVNAEIDPTLISNSSKEGENKELLKVKNEDKRDMNIVDIITKTADIKPKAAKANKGNGDESTKISDDQLKTYKAGQASKGAPNKTVKKEDKRNMNIVDITKTTGLNEALIVPFVENMKSGKRKAKAKEALTDITNKAKKQKKKTKDDDDFMKDWNSPLELQYRNGTCFLT